MNTFALNIVTPDGEVFRGQAEKLFCRTISGDICVLANHCDYCSALGMGEAHILVEGATRRAACIGGMLSVMDGEANLVATTWEWAEDIDLERAMAARERAQERLAQKDLDKREIDLAQARLKRALVRSSIKNG